MMISAAPGRRRSIPIRTRSGEPTLTEMLSDSIVMAVMAADGVDPIALEAQLRGLAQDATADRGVCC
jgi:hypothetical protein